MLERIQALVRRNRFRFSGKAARQLLEGPWTVEDFRRSILRGRLVKRVRDETGIARYKCVVCGPACNGTLLYSCGKIVRVREMEYFVITFHEVR